MFEIELFLYMKNGFGIKLPTVVDMNQTKPNLLNSA